MSTQHDSDDQFSSSPPPVAKGWMTRLGEMPDLRWQKVLSARQKISAGTYDGDDTLDALLPSLAVDVRPEPGEDLLDQF